MLAMSKIRTLICILLLSGCVGTSYRPYVETKGPNHALLSRDVFFNLSSQFYRDIPECVIVSKPTGKNLGGLGAMIELTLARHLSQKFPRLIDARERRRKLREQALDLNNDADLRYFMDRQDCIYVLRSQVKSNDSTYVGFWNDRNIGIILVLENGVNKDILWQASHSSNRSEGGIPLSPFSLGVNAFQSSSQRFDTDIEPSIVDDIVRRMIVTLPDIR